MELQGDALQEINVSLSRGIDEVGSVLFIQA